MAKREEIRMIFSGGVMCENYHFFTNPRWSEKALFCTIFFSLNIDSDHRSVHLGWLIWVFWECMVKKMINFPAKWHIKEFYNSNFFEFFVLNHSYGYLGVYFMAPRAHWQNAKKWEWFFSGGVMCEKLPFFLSPAVVRKGTILHNFFFSEYRFVITGWCIWGGLFEFFENLCWKNDKFFSTMTY